MIMKKNILSYLHFIIAILLLIHLFLVGIVVDWIFFAYLTPLYVPGIVINILMAFSKLKFTKNELHFGIVILLVLHLGLAGLSLRFRLRWPTLVFMTIIYTPFIITNFIGAFINSKIDIIIKKNLSIVISFLFLSWLMASWMSIHLFDYLDYAVFFIQISYAVLAILIIGLYVVIIKRKQK